MIKNYIRNARELIYLSLPMIMGNLGVVLIGAGDVFVAAKYSTDALAAISIANSLMMTVFLFGIGLLASVSPLLSNYRGKRTNIKKYFFPTISFSMLLSAILVGLVLICIPLVDKMGFERHLVSDIKNYMYVVAFSTFGVYLQIGLKEFLQAFEKVFLPNFLNIIGVFLNIYLNFVFVFGWYGLPEMGVMGLALATLISRLLLALVLLFLCLKYLNTKNSREMNDYNYFIDILKVGFPLASAVIVEVIAFNIITVLIGRISGVYAAAQNILLTLVNGTFMVPMALSNAIAIKVGFANGACDFAELKKYAKAGIGISVLFMSFCAVIFLTIPVPLIKIFTSDTVLLQICVPILMLAGIFQIFDGLQISLSGVLKGMKQTKVVLVGTFIAYWIIGLPLGCVLAYHFDMKLFGFWVGLTVSLFSLAMILLGLLKRKLAKLNV